MELATSLSGRTSIASSGSKRACSRQSGAAMIGLPAAIVAKIAFPERVVISFAGDGGFQMNCQELGTAMQIGAQPIVLIVNNGI
jgi:acetolactate synthase-1/2/3 large subunit